MSAGDAAPEISDYEGYDFRALWTGREKVTEVERTLLARAFAPGDVRRLLEVGTGFGRLLGSLERIAEEVVATDFDMVSLRRLGSRRAIRSETLRVAANLYHLPFADASFTGATMVRVIHHLSDPVAALAEIRRVLRPGGRLLVSYNPRPTVGTLVNDIQRALHPAPGVRFRSITFARERRVELDPEPFPIYIEPREAFERQARRAGFHPCFEFGSGIEEYYLMRHVPTEWFVRLGTKLGRAPGFPMRFAMLEVPPADSRPLPDRDTLFVCPVCHQELQIDPKGNGVRCGACPFTGDRQDGVLDLRFVPEGVARWSGHGDGG